MTFKEFFSFKANKYFWLNLLLMMVMVVALLYGVMKWLDHYTHHGEAVLVPDVKGMTLEQASPLFQKQGLSCVIADSTYVKNQPAGIILELNPTAGQKVKDGRIIYLTINTLNVPLRAVPDVADNSSFRQAQARVLAAGFKLGEAEEMFGEKDWVYGVKYKGRMLTAGEEIPLGSVLTLMVGNGLEEGEVPDSLATDSLEIQSPVTDDLDSEPDDTWF